MIANARSVVARRSRSARPLHSTPSPSLGPDCSVIASTNGEPAAAKKTRQRKPWTPSANDHLVYQWVKFEGKRQHWVASQLEISQTTVSRIIERYERWQAHAQPGDDGRLDPAERLRAQRWLTYERNEVILASALRIAGDMEGFTDVSKSVMSRPLSQPSGERELRTEHSVIDRSGVAARFLRLAFRINMEQLKLVEKEPLEPLAPLTADDIEPEEDEAAGEEPRGGEAERGRGGDESVAMDERGCEPPATGGGGEGDGGEVVIRESNEAAVVELKVHNLHNCIGEESGASAEAAYTCAATSPNEKSNRTMHKRSRRGRGGG